MIILCLCEQHVSIFMKFVGEITWSIVKTNINPTNVLSGLRCVASILAAVASRSASVHASLRALSTANQQHYQHHLPRIVQHTRGGSTITRGQLGPHRAGCTCPPHHHQLTHKGSNTPAGWPHHHPLGVPTPPAGGPQHPRRMVPAPPPEGISTSTGRSQHPRRSHETSDFQKNRFRPIG